MGFGPEVLHQLFESSWDENGKEPGAQPHYFQSSML